METVITDESISRQPLEAQAIIRVLLAKIAKMEAKVEETRQPVQSKNPKNSSLPPSTRHPHAKPASRKRKSKKKRGGQPGHSKHERPLIPTEDCDDIEPLRPTECRRCGERLSGSDPQPLRHPVWELPEIKPQVTEYQRHRLACSCCGETTCAKLPPGVPQGRTLAAARRAKRQQIVGRHVPRIIPTSGLALDVRALRWRRTDEQRGRTCVASCSHLAQAFLRHAKRWRQPPTRKRC